MSNDDTTKPAQPLELQWGAENIAIVIGRSVRATRHMLTRKVPLPGVRKIGGRWCIAPEVFYAAMRRDAA